MITSLNFNYLKLKSIKHENYKLIKELIKKYPLHILGVYIEPDNSNQPNRVGLGWVGLD